MRYITLTLKLTVIAYGAYLLWFLAFEYYPADPLGFQVPFVLWVIDTINLFIHEAGHLFFRLFGQTMYILGGSITQCLLPLALAIVTWREKPRWESMPSAQVGLPLFWFGENLVNVSVYIADAPYKNLKLIKNGLIHDWHWLLAEHLHWAEPMGLVVRGLGLVVCAASIGLMVFYLVQDFRVGLR
jgi:hypothetical protein